MPMDKKLYPLNWKEIALSIKEKADWKCENCGIQCRRPNEPFDTHKRTLTVSHQNHNPQDVRPENLKALCSACHLRYDAKHHAETRKKKEKMKTIKARNNSGDDWKTPSNFYLKLDAIYHFDFDPCPYQADFDGLKIEWGGVNFINPPYTRKLKEAFVEKALEENLK